MSRSGDAVKTGDLVMVNIKGNAIRAEVIKRVDTPPSSHAPGRREAYFVGRAQGRDVISNG